MTEPDGSVRTSRPEGPVPKGVVECPTGPANAFASWWSINERHVRRYLRYLGFSRECLAEWLAALRGVCERERRAPLASRNGMIAQNYNHALQSIVRFQTTHRSIARILGVSIDKFTPEEEAALADAIEARRVALETFRLICHARRRLAETLELRYVYLVAGPSDEPVWPVVEALILEVEAFLRETAGLHA